MPRLNLICNGMMLFHEAGDRLQIVIPEIQGHVRKFGSSDTPVKSNLQDLPNGDYEMTGAWSSNELLSDLLDATGYVTLDGDKVKFHEHRARKVSAIFSVPKPTIIRLYRASEPLEGFDLLGNCQHAVIDTPVIVHDIMVLSYKDIPAGTTVSIGPRGGPPLATATLQGSLVVPNWVLYSDEQNPFPIVEPLKLSDAQINNILTPLRHSTPLNSFLELRSVGGGSHQPTTLSLSGIGRRDTPCTPAIGATDRHLFLFHELPDQAGDPVITPVCGEAGCSGAAIVTQ
jgi:hypothetical protein